jgi:hypothetical protein
MIYQFDKVDSIYVIEIDNKVYGITTSFATARIENTNTALSQIEFIDENGNIICKAQMPFSFILKCSKSKENPLEILFNELAIIVKEKLSIDLTDTFNEILKKK